MSYGLNFFAKDKNKYTLKPKQKTKQRHTPPAEDIGVGTMYLPQYTDIMKIR